MLKPLEYYGGIDPYVLSQWRNDSSSCSQYQKGFATWPWIPRAAQTWSARINAASSLAMSFI